MQWGLPPLEHTRFVGSGVGVGLTRILFCRKRVLTISTPFWTRTQENPKVPPQPSLLCVFPLSGDIFYTCHILSVLRVCRLVLSLSNSFLCLVNSTVYLGVTSPDAVERLGNGRGLEQHTRPSACFLTVFLPSGIIAVDSELRIIQWVSKVLWFMTCAQEFSEFELSQRPAS